MIWKCPNCLTEYKIDEKFAKVLESKNDCKFCVRKDPNVMTTAEIDGLDTVEDMRNRNKVILQCQKCKKWTQMIYDGNVKVTRCNHIIDKVTQKKCMSMSFDSTSIKSLRTFNEVTDNKRKPKVKK